MRWLKAAFHDTDIIADSPNTPNILGCVAVRSASGMLLPVEFRRPSVCQSICLSVCPLVTNVYSGKTLNRDAVLVGGSVGPMNDVLNGIEIPHVKGQILGGNIAAQCGPNVGL